MKKLLLSFVVICASLCMCFGINVSDVNALDNSSVDFLEIDFTKLNVGDVFREYQDEDKNEYVQIEVLDFEPSNITRAIEGETGWSGSIPNGTYTLRPSKVYGPYEYSFKMTITVNGATATINRVYSPVTDSPLLLNQSRTLNIITKVSSPSVSALAEMSWEQTNSVAGTSAGTFSAYLGCYVCHTSTCYKVYWRI